MTSSRSTESPVSTHSPTPSGSRFEIIDIVRGFSLFGVLLVNMIWTTQWFALSGEQRAAIPTANIDGYFSMVILLFVDFKFYTIFAMLFGLGFAMQLSRSSQAGKSIVPTYLRRLSILFAFGIAHASLLWFGDILHQYALVGLLLVLFRNKSDKAILSLALVLALFTAMLPYIQWLIASDVSTGAEPETMDQAARFAALTSGGWLDVLRVNWNFFTGEYSALDFGFDTNVYWFVSIFWKFLIGFVGGRRMLLQKPDEYIGLYRRLFPWLLAIGIAGNSYLAVATWVYDIWIPESSSPLILLSWVLVDIGMFSLSLAYVSGLVIFFQKDRWRTRIGVLAPVGRMALTNYLMQSLFFVFIFFGVGLNLLGMTGTSGCLFVSFLIFGFQIIFSRWWLARYRFGPMEWLWRSLTYGKRQPFRLDSAVSA
jgi:uncharacterized protein